MFVLMLMDNAVVVVGVVVLEPEDDRGGVAYLYILDELGDSHVADKALALAECFVRAPREPLILFAPGIVGRASHHNIVASGLDYGSLFELFQKFGLLNLCTSRQGREARVLCGLAFTCHT